MKPRRISRLPKKEEGFMRPLITTAVFLRAEFAVPIVKRILASAIWKHEYNENSGICHSKTGNGDRQRTSPMPVLMRALAAIVITLSVVSVAALPAIAKKKTTRVSKLNAAIIECLKRSAAYYDPARKKWVLPSGETNQITVQDAFRDCISRRTGIPRTQIPIQEIEE